MKSTNSLFPYLLLPTLRRIALPVALAAAALTTACGGAAVPVATHAQPTLTKKPTTDAPQPTADSTKLIADACMLAAQLSNLAADPVREAEAEHRAGRSEEAKAHLLEVVKNTPRDWKPVRVDGDTVVLTSWGEEETEARCHAHAGSAMKMAWSSPSYSRAQYLLAFIAVEQRDVAAARRHIDEALRLEPDQPSILNEAGAISRIEKKPVEAVLALYKKAQERPYATRAERATALRGEAVALIDLGRLDEAGKRLVASLEIDPESKLAKDELSYVQHLRRGGAPVETTVRPK